MIQFPKITDIEQVREAIKGRPEFFEAARDIQTGTGTYKYHVFNYMVGHTDSFDCPIRRECRGLIFDANGRILSRRFHKFFNLGEKEETFPDRIDWSQPHVIQTKFDGSMITPLVFDRHKETIRWATKMGVTDIANLVYRFANKDRRYHNAAIAAFDTDVTPIFEYVGPYNRIVIPYASEDLILLAMRDNITGKYLKPDDVEYFAKSYRVPVVTRSIFKVNELKDQIDVEGVVVAFDSGMKVKIKTEWYCAIHRAKENLLHEKSVLKLILEEKIDDVIPFLFDHDKKCVQDYMASVLEKIDEVTEQIYNIHVENDQGVDRKTFALQIAPKLPKFIVSIVFATWESHKSDIRKHVIKQYLKKTSCQTDVDSIREYIGTTWIPTTGEEI